MSARSLTKTDWDVYVSAAEFLSANAKKLSTESEDLIFNARSVLWIILLEVRPCCLHCYKLKVEARVL